MTNRVGQKVGNYQILSLLGKGGFSEVYLGEHIYLKNKAALKFLHARLSDEDLSHFQEEGRLLASLVHPHIVRVLDFGLDENVPFLVLDHAPNGSLRRRHPRGSIIPLNTVVAYVQQSADALQYAHDQRVIHRDIKPENMLLGLRHEVLLSDFGIALMGQSTRSQGLQEIAGTAAYMAPEQFQGMPRAASDQYSLGVVVYEWLTGYYPFKGSFTEIASQHLLTPAPPLREKIPSLAPEVEQVVLTAMAKDPKQRFPNVRAFASALQQAWQASVTYPPVLRLPSTLPGQESQQVWPGTPSQPHTPLPNMGPISIDGQASISGIASGQGNIAGMPMQGNMNSMRSLPGQAPQPGIVGISGLGEWGEAESTVLAMPSGQAGTNTSGVQLPFPGMSSLPPQVMTPPSEIVRPASARVSRRTLLIGGGVAAAVVAVAGIAGGSLLLRRNVTSITIPTPTPAPPTPSPVIFGLNPQHTRHNLDEHILSPVNVTRLVQVWATPTGGGFGISSPTVVNGVLYIGNFAGKLNAIQVATGKILWTKTIGQINSTPAFDKDIIYIGALDQNLYAINAANGNTLWATTLGGKISASPVISNGNVYIGASDGKLYAINASTGRIRWVGDTGAANLLISSPAIDKNVIYLGSWDGKLYAFDVVHGKIMWTTPTAGPIFSSPAIANGVVYIGSRDGKLYACDAITGKILWTVSTTNLIASSPAVAYGMVYFGSKDGKLYAVEIATGTVRWWLRTGGEVDSSPLVANGVVYFGSWDYTLYAANAITGDLLWKKTTGKPIESSPTVVNGVLYIGSNDQNVYAFALPSGTQ